MKIISDNQKQIIESLNDSTYTIDFIQEWINRNDNVFINAPSALQAVAAKGFYNAVLAIEKQQTQEKSLTDKLFALVEKEVDWLKINNMGFESISLRMRLEELKGISNGEYGECGDVKSSDYYYFGEPCKS